MIDPPQIVKTNAQLTAVIRFTIPRHEIRNVMGPGCQELFATVAAQGLKPIGPRFSHHFAMQPDTFDFEIGVPIDRPITPAGRVVAGQLPAATVARTVYHGPYEGLGGGWEAMMKWVEANGHTPAANLWECYVAGPESGADASAWRTELNRPLRAAADKAA